MRYLFNQQIKFRVVVFGHGAEFVSAVLNPRSDPHQIEQHADIASAKRRARSLASELRGLTSFTARQYMQAANK